MAALVLASLTPVVSAAGDWAPVRSCAPSATDASQTAITLQFFNHAPYTICRIAVDPAAYGGLSPLPLTSLGCPEGWTCEPDSIPGGVVYLACLGFEHLSPEVTILAPATSIPVRLTFSDVDGSGAEIRFKILSCPPTPTSSSTWGRLKSSYR
jgi:hypothetical protein